MTSKNTSIAFIFPPGREPRPFEQRPFDNHLGEAYIQAYLAKYGITSKQIISPLGSTLNDCVKQIISTDAKLFGFTCYDNNYFLVRTIASLIKQKRPESIVIAGGPTATFSDKLLLANTPEIDICVRFEGEESTLQLVLLNSEGMLKDRLEDVDGITFRRDHSIIRTPDRSPFGYSNDKECCLDGLPSPYLEGIFDGTEGAGIITARGCTHHCTYCNFSAMSKHTIRYHSIDRVIAELQYISSAMKSHSLNSMDRTNWIYDDAFTLNPRRAKKICERIIDEGIRLRLSCMCRADTLDKELIELLSQAGFEEISFGVESAVPKILNNIKKVSNNKQDNNEGNYPNEERFLSKVREGVATAKRYGMKIAVSIILGLPGETIDDGLKTAEFIRELGVDNYSHNYLMLFSGTDLFTTAKNYGIKFRPSACWLPYNVEYAYPVHEIPYGNNSSLQEFSKHAAKIILKTFAGGPDVFRGIENGIVLASIEQSSDNSFFDSIKWLSNNLAIGGRLAIHGKEEDTIDDFYRLLEVNFKMGLPTSDCYYLRSCSESGSELIYEVINKPLYGRLIQWNPRFPLVRLNNCIRFAKNHDPTQSQIFPIYCINDMVDVDFLSRLSDNIAQKITSRKISSRVWLDGVFLDGCRWMNSTCPALKLRRVVIKKTGDILPCMTGQPLGRLSDNIQDLRENAKNILENIREERRCEDCPADSRCAKCLFPYPLNWQKYCELQRNNLNISWIVTRSNLANTTDVMH